MKSTSPRVGGLLTEMHSARARCSGLASRTVAWKVKCAFNASGLQRMGLEGGRLEMINDLLGSFEWTRILLKKHENSKSIWHKRARADWLLALEKCSCTGHMAAAGLAQTTKGAIRAPPLFQIFDKKR